MESGHPRGRRPGACTAERLQWPSCRTGGDGNPAPARAARNCNRRRQVTTSFIAGWKPAGGAPTRIRIMAVIPKTPEELEGMRVAGRLAAEVLALLKDHVKPGVTTEEIDRIAHDHIVNVQKAV